jgi:putative oxidoreductase
MEKWYPVVGRVLLGLLFLGGVFKFMNVAAVTGYIASVGIPMASLVFWVSTIVEVGSALALIFGYRVSTFAWVLFVYTGLATIFFHNNLADQMQMTMALKNLAIMGGLLYVIVYESGMKTSQAAA